MHFQRPSEVVWSVQRMENLRAGSDMDEHRNDWKILRPAAYLDGRLASEAVISHNAQR